VCSAVISGASSGDGSSSGVEPAPISSLVALRDTGSACGELSWAGAESPSLPASLSVSVPTWLSLSLAFPVFGSLECAAVASWSSKESLPLTQQALQKYFLRSPMWHANSLCIGLSPSSARTDGIMRTSSFNSLSHAQIPSFCPDLRAGKLQSTLAKRYATADPKLHQASPKEAQY
jgi:hypothetical protein